MKKSVIKLPVFAFAILLAFTLLNAFRPAAAKMPFGPKGGYVLVGSWNSTPPKSCQGAVNNCWEKFELVENPYMLRLQEQFGQALQQSPAAVASFCKKDSNIVVFGSDLKAETLSVLRSGKFSISKEAGKAVLSDPKSGLVYMAIEL